MIAVSYVCQREPLQQSGRPLEPTKTSRSEMELECIKLPTHGEHSSEKHL
jgi:hypothetical protein